MKASQLRPGNVYLRKGHSLRASPTAYLLVSTRRWKLTREIGDRMVRPVLTVPDSTDRLSRSRYMNRSETTIGFLAVTLPDAMVEQLTQHVADPAFDVSQFPPIKQLHRRALDDLDEAPDVEHITDRLIEGDRFHAEPLADPLDGTVLVIPADLDGELALMARAREDHYRRQRLAAQRGQSARALARPTLRCDFLMLDEAQDTPPVLTKVVLDQACQLVVVGDSAQQIYGWAGAIDAMGKMITADPNVIECFLTQSWRFGEVIATEANKWLGQLPTPLRLSGNPGLDSELVDLGSDARAVLRRTNVGAVGEVISALFAGRAVAMVGGGGEIKSLAYAARDLMSGRPTEHPELSAYDNWNEVRAAAQGGDGDDSLKAFVAMVDRFGPNSLIDAMAKLVPEKAAELVVSTAHKAKGREWDSVRICGDFEQRMDEEGEPKPLDSTDAMLAYVAVTRARLRLDRGPLAYIDELTGSTASVATG
jgi:hypothetical protein